VRPPQRAAFGCRAAIAARLNTILRHLKGFSTAAPMSRPLRIVGIDDWAWTKGQRYGTIMVDFESRTVADVLAGRSSTSVALWLDSHLGIEIICRDRHGLYATVLHRYYVLDIKCL
jgi:transposase